MDPYLTRNRSAHPLQNLGPGDFGHTEAVFITHGHFDRTYDVPVELSGTPVYASSTVCSSLELRGVSRDGLRPRRPGETARWAPSGSLPCPPGTSAPRPKYRPGSLIGRAEAAGPGDGDGNSFHQPAHGILTGAYPTVTQPARPMVLLTPLAVSRIMKAGQNRPQTDAEEIARRIR